MDIVQCRTERPLQNCLLSVLRLWENLKRVDCGGRREEVKRGGKGLGGLEAERGVVPVEGSDKSRPAGLWWRVGTGDRHQTAQTFSSGYAWTSVCLEHQQHTQLCRLQSAYQALSSKTSGSSNASTHACLLSTRSALDSAKKDECGIAAAPRMSPTTGSCFV